MTSRNQGLSPNDKGRQRRESLGTRLIEEHKGSAIGNHPREQHDIEPEDITPSFRILRKCQNKFVLVYETFFVKELKPTLKKTVRFSSHTNLYNFKPL